MDEFLRECKVLLRASNPLENVSPESDAWYVFWSPFENCC